MLFPMTSENAKFLADFLLGQLRHEAGVTRKVLAAVPADTSSYKPSEKCMSGIELAAHLATAEAFFMNGVLDGEFKMSQPPALKTPGEVVAWYESTVPALYDRV